MLIKTYKLELDTINHCNLSINVSIRNNQDVPIAFASQKETPILVVSDKSDSNKRLRISSSGILKRKGDWLSE